MRNGAGTRPRSQRLCQPGYGVVAHPSTLSSAAFSLIELLFVIAILVLVAFLYTGSMTTHKKHGMKSYCASNLQKIYVALNMYRDEHEGRYPVVANARTSAEGLSLLVPQYSSETSIFICPGIWEPKELPTDSFGKQTISYSYYMGRTMQTTNAPLMSDRQVDTSSKTNGQRLFSPTGNPPGNNHQQSGGNILFCDGEVRSVGTNAPDGLELNNGVVLLNP